jgi:sulfate adenylyltransferase subunit 1
MEKKKSDIHISNQKMSEKFDSASYLNMELLRFTTAGSVDDGKSTLIGRLLFDSKAIFQDQLDAIERTSIRKGENKINFAYLTDGLKAELEQGITIDVAYRYFSTPKRKFIIADTPGHIQYTRNMVTGASTANLAIVLVDARKGIVEQTKRHSLIASLLGIPHLAICINKMDLVDWNEDIYQSIKESYKEFASKLAIKDVNFIPISALLGDNIVKKSENMSWYEGSTLMYLLENVHISNDNNLVDARFAVQGVIRPQNDQHHDYRAYSGKMLGGILRKGDRIVVAPSGFSSVIKSIQFGEKELQEAFVPQSVSIQLEDNIDISRGDMITRENNPSKRSQDIEAMICWMGEKPLSVQNKYIIKHTTKEAKAMVKSIKYKMDINTLSRIPDEASLLMNDIGKVVLRTTSELMYDTYQKNRNTGSFILIDEATNVTVGAGMIIDSN